MTFYHGVEVLETEAGPRPIATLSNSVIGVVGIADNANAAAYPLNTPVLVTSRSQLAALKGLSGYGLNDTLPDALASIFDQSGAVVVVVRIDGSGDAEATQAAAVAGVEKLRDAQPLTGYTPGVIIAPGLTGTSTAQLRNAVVAAMLTYAHAVRAVVVADGPNTTDTAAFAYAEQHDDVRLVVVDPALMRTRASGGVGEVPASATVAGLIARSDVERGFWWSPSNQVIQGALGTARPVDFAYGDPSCRANLLNENRVTTVINLNGLRLWGNRSTGDDPFYSFLCVRRTADVIFESIQRAHLWAVDRGITRTYVKEVQEGVNAFLRSLKAQGAIIGGECFIDPAKNTPDQIAQGRIEFEFDFTPVYPAERVVFRGAITNNYLTELFE